MFDFIKRLFTGTEEERMNILTTFNVRVVGVGYMSNTFKYKEFTIESTGNTVKCDAEYFTRRAFKQEYGDRVPFPRFTLYIKEVTNG